jgi:hypothetical protein
MKIGDCCTVSELHSCIFSFSNGAVKADLSVSTPFPRLRSWYQLCVRQEIRPRTLTLSHASLRSHLMKQKMRKSSKNVKLSFSPVESEPVGTSDVGKNLYAQMRAVICSYWYIAPASYNGIIAYRIRIIQLLIFSCASVILVHME